MPQLESEDGNEQSAQEMRGSESTWLEMFRSETVVQA
jgi:hypothetical protein